MTAPDWRFGPAPAPGGTRFRIWAPGVQAMTVEVEGLDPLPLQPAGEGWLEAVAPCGPGARYRFRTPDGTAVPDPASRFQPEDVHGPSQVTDPQAYGWRARDWSGRPWSETVLYELHPGLLGGYRGVAEKLPELADLGVTAVELMPVAEFPGARNWGYDGVLPFAPDGAYGSPDDLKALVDRAHELGLMVFLDVVYNHFGPDGNYLSLYAPQFFREDIKTPWGAAIDFRQPPVRRYFTENALYWLHEFRFDGLRFDAVHAISDETFLDELAAEVRASLPGRHIHLVLENDLNRAGHLSAGFDAQWNDDVHHVLHVLLTGQTSGYYEDYADAPASRLARALAEGFVYQGEPSAHRKGEPRGTPSDHLPPTAFVDFLQNHDQIGNRAFGERLTVLAEEEPLKAAVAALLLSAHIPMIFMGEEIGARDPFLYFTDHEPELAEAVRNGRREEFAAFPEFSDPERRQEIPDPNAEATFRASLPRRRDVSDQWLDLYRRLLKIRRDLIAPRLKGAQSLGAEAVGDKAVLARWRLSDGAVLTLGCNLGLAPVRAELPGVAPLWGAAEEGALPAASTVAWIAEL